MLVDERGNIEGSVTGGCVEAALVEEAQGIFAGEAPRVVTYGSVRPVNWRRQERAQRAGDHEQPEDGARQCMAAVTSEAS